ncbi:MAG: hypothetical protein KDJ19_08105 [Hyphomicrobiaceae bacterium]|nr:hypothetical protein [Hyphomicrobiaceae bacterium]MCC0024101.1 hypothetical protein [Hyphomicrobiaceae bacterium]
MINAVTKSIQLTIYVILITLIYSCSDSDNIVRLISGQFKDGLVKNNGVIEYSDIATKLIGEGALIGNVEKLFENAGVKKYEVIPDSGVNFFDQKYYGDNCLNAEEYLVYRFFTGFLPDKYTHLVRMAFVNGKLFCINASASPTPIV